MQVLQIYSQEKVPRTLLSPRFFFDLVEVIILRLLININFERVLILPINLSLLIKNVQISSGKRL